MLESMKKFLHKSDRPNLFTQLQYVIERKGVNSMEHYGSTKSPAIKTEFEEFRNMFKETKKYHDQEFSNQMGSCEVCSPDEEELGVKQEIINKLVVKRYEDEDNDFLRITKMNYFEQFVNYKDKYPLFNFRMKLWYIYIWMNYIARLIISHWIFETFSILVIITNSIFLALEDPTKTIQADYLELSEKIFLYIYTVEMGLKILGLGFILNRGSYLRDVWNILDFIIVVSAYMTLLQSGGSFNLSGLRSLRVLRPLKTVTAIKKLRSLIITIFSAIPYLIEIMIVLIFVFLIFAIAGLQLFSGLLQNNCMDQESGKLYINHETGEGPFMCTSNSCPSGSDIYNPPGFNPPFTNLICAKNNVNPDGNVSNFDNIMSSFLMVYIVTTLEGWTLIMSYVQRSFSYFFCFFFIMIVFIGGFFLINLTLAVITIKFNESQDKAKEERKLLLKTTNDDYFVILPNPKLPQVKYNYNELNDSVSLTRMRANNEFELSKITKIDGIVGTFKKYRYTQNNIERGVKESEAEIKKVEKETFDDLWDWRLEKGNLFAGPQLKKTVDIYSSQESNFPVLKESTRPLRQMKVENLIQEEDEEPSEDQEGEVDKDHEENKKAFRDLLKMTDMTSDAIHNKFGRALKKKGQLQNPALAADKETKKEKYTKNIEAPKIDEFQISDDEDKKKQKTAHIVDPTNPEELKKFRAAKSFLKSVIRKRKERAGERFNFVDLKMDEDFCLVGGVQINKNYDEPPEKNSEAPDGERPSSGEAVTVQEKSESVKGSKISGEEESQKKSDNEEEAIEEDDVVAELKNNKAFKALQNIISPEKRTLVRGAKKKKKHDDELMTPEKIQESKIVKYYQKTKYEYLKLEPHFTYGHIPQPAFNSIFDVLPLLVDYKKDQSLAEQIKEQAEIQLPMTYTMVELKKKKRKKKKKDDKKKQELASNVTTGNNSFNEFSDESFDGGESDGESSYGDERSDINLLKGSQAKKDRKIFLMENEKFIIRKPFPLNEQTRKNQILNAMRSSFIPKNNQVSASQTGLTSSSKRRNDLLTRTGGENLKGDFQVTKDGFDKDKLEDEKAHRELLLKEGYYDYQNLYMTIRSNDMEKGELNKYNWSGNQIMTTSNFTLSQTEKTISSLNTQKLDIWMKEWSGFLATSRRYCREFIESSAINGFLMFSVFANTLILAADGLTPESWSDLMTNLNLAFTIIFTVECAIKIFGLGVRRYAKDLFNVFDFLVVVISLVEVAVNAANSSGGGNKKKNAASAFRAVRIFRIFRVLRVTRLLRSLRFMQVIIEVVKETVEQFLYIALLMFLFVFIFTLLGTQFFGGEFTFMKDYSPERYNFDSFESAFYTVFIVLTLENWNSILINCLRSDANAFITIIYLMSWIFIGNYIFLNLFLAILLDGFESSDTLQMIEEIEQEDKELERTHKNLIKSLEEKKKNEYDEHVKATEKVMLIIEPDKHMDKQEIKKNQPIYLVMRNDENDNESINEHLDMSKHLYKGFNKSKIKVDPLENLSCNQSLFYFRKTSKIRKFCSKIASHRWFETWILVLIVISSIKLVVETYIDLAKDDLKGKISNYIDRGFTILFTLESVVKIVTRGFFVAPDSYLRDPWSILDFFIVITSWIDWAVESVNLPVLKVLRLLRTLRPLRFISRNQNMRIVVNALLESLIAILNVLIVIGMVWVMFAILGSNLMQGKLGYCEVDAVSDFNYYGVNKSSCVDEQIYNGTWKNAYWNFDDIGQSMVTLYALSTMEGWPDMLASALDAQSEDKGPKYMSSSGNAFFFIFFILVGSLFLMNLFVGVIFVQFSEEQRKERNSRFYMVTESQMRWIMVQELVVQAKANFDVMLRPKGRFRILVFRMINSKMFESVIMICIILNIAALGMTYEAMNDTYESVLTYINLTFSIIFIIEFLLKFIALDFQYFTSSWNIFDFTIVMLSIVDIVLDNAGGSVGFLKQAPQVARMLRVLRVSRLFKLMKAKQLQGINKIIKTLLFSLPSLMNVLVLLFLVYFIFSILAWFLFSNVLVEDLDYRNEIFGFTNFHTALMTLFRCSTGEDWPMFMYTYAERMKETGEAGGGLIAKLFFLIYIFLSSTVMINVFQLVVMQQFDEYYFNPDNPINSFDEISTTFRDTWNQFTIKTRGSKIKVSKIIEFFYYLEIKEDSEDEEDIGELLNSREKRAKMKKPHFTRFEIAKHINMWNLHMDSQGYLPYRFVLQAAIANSFGNKSLFYSTYEAYKRVKKKEMECKAEILKELAKKAKTTNKKEYLYSAAKRYANPLRQILYMRLALITWERYIRMFDTIALEKDEVDIDSDDFVLDELKDELEEEEKLKLLAKTSNLAQLKNNKMSFMNGKENLKSTAVQGLSARTKSKQKEHSHSIVSREGEMEDQLNQKLNSSQLNLAKRPSGVENKKSSPAIAARDLADASRGVSEATIELQTFQKS